MPRSYDSGASAPIRTLVRDHVVTRLARLKRTDASGEGFLKALIPYGGVVRSYTDEIGLDELYTALNGRTPSVAVALGDKTYKPAGTGGYQFAAVLDVHVYFASKHARTMIARHEGDAVADANLQADPGIDVMMELVEELLIGERSTSGGNTTPVIKSFTPLREEELVTLPELTLWVQTYQVEVTRTIDKNRDVTKKLQGFMTTLTTTISDDEATLVFETPNLEPPP